MRQRMFLTTKIPYHALTLLPLTLENYSLLCHLYVFPPQFLKNYILQKKGMQSNGNKKKKLKKQKKLQHLILEKY